MSNIAEKSCKCHGEPMAWEYDHRGGQLHCSHKLRSTPQERNRRQNESKRSRKQQIVSDERSIRGGKCEIEECEWWATLDWHHRDPEQKLFSIGEGITNHGIGQEALLLELAKCDMICPNHHSMHALQSGMRRPS